MIKKFNELKKDLKVGTKIRCTFHAFRLERVGEISEIAKVQTNSVKYTNNVCLDFPPTSVLVEYIDNTFTFYEAGYRELTIEEEKLLNKCDELCTKEERESDVYTDSNICYYKEKAFLKANGAEYLFGFKEIRGLYYNINTKKIRDNQIRGKKLYSFEII